MVREISPYVRNDSVVTQGDAFCVMYFLFPHTFHRDMSLEGKGADGRAAHTAFLYILSDSAGLSTFLPVLCSSVRGAYITVDTWTVR